MGKYKYITIITERRDTMQRTDLAAEAHKLCCDDANLTQIEGVKARESTKHGIRMTEVRVIDEQGARTIGKPCGTYTTIEAPQLKYSPEQGEIAAECLAEAIRSTGCLDPEGLTLVAGLGNRDITPDTIGIRAAEGVLVTNHLAGTLPKSLAGRLSGVCVLIPGVLGTTGMETAEVIKAVVQQTEPSCVIAVDALAAADFSRVGTTIQVGDSGINPGSGVGNDRAALNEKTLGVPVIAVGVPTVADVETSFGTAMVTPRDIDMVAKRAAAILAEGINMALQPQLSKYEIELFTG